MTVIRLFSNVTFTSYYEDKLMNLTLINCSLTHVDFLPISILRNLLYLDLSFNGLVDFKFPTPAHFMRLLIVLKLTGNQLVVGSFFLTFKSYELSLLFVFC